MGILFAILLFSFIVIFHELGHFLTAKLFGIRVDEFSLGLGPTLIGKKIGGTKFSLKALPFGGACVMGEDDVEDTSEGSFNSKNVWQRIAVIAGGPIFNLILGLVICSVMVGMTGYARPVVSAVESGYGAAKAGLRAEDTITRIGGHAVHTWDDISLYNLTHQEESSVSVTYRRDGEVKKTVVELSADGKAGYKRLGIIGPEEMTRPSGIGVLRYGFYRTKYWLDYTVASLRMLFTGKVGLKDMSGPVGIVSAVDGVYKSSIVNGVRAAALGLLTFGALLTVNLGVMNLFPLPALDGGRLIFLFIEAVRGRRVSPEKEGYVHMAGFILLMGLMVVILFNDIWRLFV